MVLEILLSDMNKYISKDILYENLNSSDGSLRVYISKLKKIGFDIRYNRIQEAYGLSN
jgi:biotin operon repressor